MEDNHLAPHHLNTYKTLDHRLLVFLQFLTIQATHAMDKSEGCLEQQQQQHLHREVSDLWLFLFLHVWQLFDLNISYLKQSEYCICNATQISSGINKSFTSSSPIVISGPSSLSRNATWHPSSSRRSLSVWIGMSTSSTTTNTR